MTEFYVLPISEVSLEFYSKITGFSVSALRARIRKEHWLEGIEYVRNPTGKIVVNIPAAQAWERKAWHEKAESAAPSRQFVPSSESGFAGEAQQNQSRNFREKFPLVRRIPRPPGTSPRKKST